ncbi:MAG TPA: FAD-dependent oxidoreductase [Pirellulales bacterium]|jgi:phytoene dehydrogenase-like protein
MNSRDAVTPHSAPQETDVIVVGAGLAGLMAAAVVARAGRSVQIVEQAGHAGGRAATNQIKNVQFNLGAHALYAGGHACRLLREMQIPFAGHFPSQGRPLLLQRDTSYRLPTNLLALFSSQLLTFSEKRRMTRFFVTIKNVDARQLDGTTTRAWIEQAFGRGNLASFIASLVRVATYVDDVDRLSAGAAIDQLRLALTGNVLYLDGGWQTIVAGLRQTAIENGATLRTSSRADSTDTTPDGLLVRLSGGETIRGRTVILAVEPDAACRLLDRSADSFLVRWMAQRVAVSAACLDVALDRLPRPRDRFALGLDRPMYYSVHSAAARLGPDGVHVLHLMKYLRHDRDEAPEAVGAELESFLDQLQPGWRSHVVARRLLPRMIVSHAIPLASDGGLAGRPSVNSAEIRNVFLAGDWVGTEGMLADASAASAVSAAQQALESLRSHNRSSGDNISTNSGSVDDRESVLYGRA